MLHFGIVVTAKKRPMPVWGKTGPSSTDGKASTSISPLLRTSACGTSRMSHYLSNSLLTLTETLLNSASADTLRMTPKKVFEQRKATTVSLESDQSSPAVNIRQRELPASFSDLSLSGRGFLRNSLSTASRFFSASSRDIFPLSSAASISPMASSFFKFS